MKPLLIFFLLASPLTFSLETKGPKLTPRQCKNNGHKICKHTAIACSFSLLEKKEEEQEEEVSCLNNYIDCLYEAYKVCNSGGQIHSISGDTVKKLK